MFKENEFNAAEVPKDVDESQRASSAAGETSREDSNLAADDPTPEEIAARAYQCWEQRGGAHGRSEEDWYRAEQELRAERAGAGRKTRSASASAA
jgi:hypothetical protein